MLGIDGSIFATASYATDTESFMIDVISAFNQGTTRAYIEEVRGLPNMRRNDIVKLADSGGFNRGVVKTLGIPLVVVQAKAWHKGVGFKAKKGEAYQARKKRLLQHAQELFPQFEVTKHICDAILIAEYGRRQERNGSQN